jgi:hypothetical protein
VSDSAVNIYDDNDVDDGWTENDDLSTVEQFLDTLVAHLHPMILPVFLK